MSTSWTLRVVDGIAPLINQLLRAKHHREKDWRKHLSECTRSKLFIDVRMICCSPAMADPAVRGGADSGSNYSARNAPFDAVPPIVFCAG